MSPDMTYFMGQGPVHFALRQANGPIIGGYVFAGDGEALQVSNNPTFDDITENVSGNRNVAAHIPTGNAQGFKFTAKQWTTGNLVKAMLALPGAAVAAGTVTGEAISAWGGTMAALANPNVTSVVAVLAGGTAKVASVAATVAGTGGTPGAALPVTFTGGTPTTAAAALAIINAAGGIDHIEMTNYGAGYTAPPTATVAGVTGATLVVNMGGTALVADTDYTLDAKNGAMTFLPGSTVVPAAAVPLTGKGLGTPISVNYAYDSYQARLEAATSGPREYSVRFHGMNTANDRSPVIVTLHRVSLNPARLFDLIAARSGSLDLEGMLLPAPERNGTTQSQYWSFVKV